MIGKTFGIPLKNLVLGMSMTLEKVWNEMDQIEPLTPITQSQREC